MPTTHNIPTIYATSVFNNTLTHILTLTRTDIRTLTHTDMPGEFEVGGEPQSLGGALDHHDDDRWHWHW